MLSVGTDIQSSMDALKMMTVEHLYQSLRNPKPELADRLRQLRIIRQVNPQLYVRSKRLLPYFVCATFNPAIRRTENFAYTSYFVLDLDHLEDKQLDLVTVRTKIQSDPRVLLSFLSPSQDGLKVMFRLSERCYDAGIYKLFYKEFVRRFSQQYGLEQVADMRTCDVCRACFISIDPDAYYNEQSEPVVLAQYIDQENPFELFALKQEQERADKEHAEKESNSANKQGDEPNDDALKRIKGTLNKNNEKKSVPHLPIYVPDRLVQIMDSLKAFIEDQGIEVYDVRDIQYGKKIMARLENRLAEINLFYGKHGFKVIPAVKGVLSAEFNEVLADVIRQYLDDNT